MTFTRAFRIAASFAAVAASTSGAQSVARADDRVADAIARWITLPAPPGGEELGAALLTPALPGWTRDANGNLIRRVGQGSPRRVVACALDVSAYVVSQITDDGYLRLHRTGAAPPHPLWDQAMEAQRVRIYTARGAVPGVVAIANGHFARQHRGDTTIVGVDQLWVDVGASARGEVERLGISVLDPVIADRPAWTYEGYAAGPGAGVRAGCAAVATAAQGSVSSGETIFVLSVQHVFNWTGLSAALSRIGKYDELVLVGETRSGRGGASQPGRSIVPRTRFTGSHVESIHAAEARALLAQVASAASVTLGADPPWVAPLAPVPQVRAARAGSYDNLERELITLLDLPGVPGHEWRVRNAVRAALPAWARDRATVDSAGNLIVAVGPDRDSVVFIAHTDEVSFEVERILADGSVTLTRKGGVVPSAWEGQPALLHFDQDASGHVTESLRGVFVPRDTARVKAPRTNTAWFGLDSAALASRGVHAGSAVLGYKHAERLSGTRITGRASDDRTGSTALLAATRATNPAALTHKVLFVWSTGEEGGLLGARAFGARHGASLRRAYAIDTFVSSDTPLESPTFAFAPLGKGAVLRGLDDGSVASRAERDRVVRIARAAGIPLQLGTTHGSTDGSAIGAFGPPNLGLSWPGRYSHTPGEVLDLRDLDALARLIAALAAAPER
ncbi:MAG TPA: M20/M25/M40 family metallo-hydrolase [Gemmatimonadaceae bacterium]|nr:M20/M25/M40 family metallo-hydrolase [Gemmatimonadaceae bacterium]